jgi:hypothetical protein
MRPDNEVDKERFEKLKETEMKRGRSEDKATEVSAGQVKELRAREGRGKVESKSDVPITTTSS